ncbi:hypothetical protein M5362_01250 [Streptomyces sp. Je 1-79]|uniref:hypothetical protein n=1 Tax=Streptomyces sp. Je 1-79 TaxID=2943847 RepID=UPI0021A86561|nr:hypothetical protein [Streptomyces sp. Je 1-79]MCT4351759.1 hypothetical protein [Streptomyces sp. Je 1-79]
MTSDRRALGQGPFDELTDSAEAVPRRKQATEADLDTGLPSLRLPNLDELRARGVLARGHHDQPDPPPTNRRTLGTAAEAPPQE